MKSCFRFIPLGFYLQHKEGPCVAFNLIKHKECVVLFKLNEAQGKKGTGIIERTTPDLMKKTNDEKECVFRTIKSGFVLFFHLYLLRLVISFLFRSCCGLILASLHYIKINTTGTHERRRRKNKDKLNRNK